jgi:hypothetical protein
MSRASIPATAAFVLTTLALSATLATADPRTCPGSTPSPNGAYLVLRVFNDCPSSTVVSTNHYPALVSITDADNDCFGFANLHGWNFSTDGGVTPALFENCSAFRYSADVTLSGTGGGEGGLRISPWWNAPLYAVDGRFMLNASSGEIACFGARLPFYSFTGAHGLRYVKGTVAHMEIVYQPNDLSSSNPATITYNLTYKDTLFTSGPLALDEGNVAEAPDHGAWGLLNASGVGGYVQCLVGAGTAVDLTGAWANIQFATLDADGDGVPDAADACPGSAPGAVVDAHGCSIEQLAPCAGPAHGEQPPVAWKNHGEYVSTVAHVAESFLAAGLITEAQKDAVVSAAGRSSCGKGTGHGVVLRPEVTRTPAQPLRVVHFELAEPAMARLSVHDVSGRLVADLFNGSAPAGEQTVRWDASRLPSGVYFYTLRAGADLSTSRFVVLR